MGTRYIEVFVYGKEEEEEEQKDNDERNPTIIPGSAPPSQDGPCPVPMSLAEAIDFTSPGGDGGSSWAVAEQPPPWACTPWAIAGAPEFCAAAGSSGPTGSGAPSQQAFGIPW